MKMRSINPFTEEVAAEFDVLPFEECAAAAGRAREAFAAWRAVPIGERRQRVRKAGELLRENINHCARIATEEMGKPVRQSVAEVEKCAWLCSYYAGAAEEILRDEIVPTEGRRSLVTFEPLGVILGVMPWNFPFWQVIRCAIPAMAAGNVCLLKHASNVPRTALEIERIMHAAGFPKDVFQTLLTDAASAMRLIEDDLVDGVSLTGSGGAGSQVGAAAGKRIKKLVLELGGSDPFIVLDDADIDKAAEMALNARFLNTGQSCVAAKRIIVQEGVAKEFQVKLLEGFQKLKVGDPMDESVFMGPVAKREFAEALEEQLADARAKGATVHLGQEPPRGKGYFFRPAVVTNVTPDMKLLGEEVFGPILPIVVAGDEDEIVRIANATEYGLGASVWSRDLGRAEAMARRIVAGCVAVNDMVKSDPRLPFGGVKKSGVGRELSHYGLKEFTNVKTIMIQAP